MKIFNLLMDGVKYKKELAIFIYYNISEKII